MRRKGAIIDKQFNTVITDNEKYEIWSLNNDGASKICRLLFEEATDINFYVGRAVNPAHQNPDLPINFNIKMNLVQELSKALKEKGIDTEIVQADSVFKVITPVIDEKDDAIKALDSVKDKEVMDVFITSFG